MHLLRDYIYFLKLPPQQEGVLNCYKKYISNYKQRYFDTINLHSSYAKLAADLFLKYILSKVGQPLQEVFVEASGKPYLLNRKLNFNISHSGSFLVCVISKQTIGIDIEKKRIINNAESIASRFFLEDEYNIIRGCSDNSKSDLFLRFWTLKESFAKMLGTGIFKEIKSISFADYIKQFCFYVPEKRCFFECFDKEEYVLSVCSKVKRNSAIEQVYWSGVLQFYNDLEV